MLNLRDLAKEAFKINKLREQSNPEGDKLVNNFLKKIAKEFNYPISEAAAFVTSTIKKLGF